jgi:hypothetical protein
MTLAEIMTMVVAARYFRLHLVCTPDVVPVSFRLLPGALHDLRPI